MRWAVFGLCLLAAATILGGCLRESGQDGGRIVLRIADWGGASDDDEFNRVNREVYATFERMHPGVELKIEHIPGSQEYVFKLLAQHVAGTAPDVVFLDASSSAAFINNGVVTDLTPLIREDPEFDPSIFFPNVYDIARRGNKVYALPGNFTPMVVYYNKRVFRERGVPYPEEGWTWDDFLRTCQALSDPARDRYGFYFVNWMPGWITWIWQNGGDVLSPEGTRATGYLNGPRTVEAVQFFTDLVSKYRVAPTISESAATGTNLFQSGEAAMEISGHWAIVGYKAAESEKFRFADLGVVGLPRHRQRVTVMYESGPAITRQCRHPKMAWEFIKYFSGAEVQDKLCGSGLAIAAVRAVAEARRHTSPLEPVFLREIRYARAPWGAEVEGYAYVEDVGRDAIERILIGKVPVQKALDDAARKIDHKLFGLAGR
ncbi:MAG: ABC transporter substrate-binding protein [Fimbriimonadales bacterium]